MMANVNDVIAWEEGRMNEKQEARFFQKLVDSGESMSLQGMYGRRAMQLAMEGKIKLPKKKLRSVS